MIKLTTPALLYTKTEETQCFVINNEMASFIKNSRYHVTTYKEIHLLAFLKMIVLGTVRLLFPISLF